MRVDQVHGDRESPHYQGMMTFTQLVPRPLILLSRSPIGRSWRQPPAWRFKDSSREHTESGQRCYLSRCIGQGPYPLVASGLRDGTAP